MLQRPLFWEGRGHGAGGGGRQRWSSRYFGVVLTPPGVYGTGETMGVIATVGADVRRIGMGESVKGWQFTEYESGCRDL